MGVYRLEVASSNRAKCNGKIPCKGTTIPKGSLRLGTWVEIPSVGSGSFKWRHWGCTTDKVLENLQTDFNEASEIDGYEDLPESYQRKVDQAWKVGAVDDADIPETARVPEKPEEEGGGEETTPKKPKATKGGKKVKAEADAAEEEDVKPKKGGKKVKAESKPEVNGDADSKEDVKPSKSAKKTAQPKKSTKAKRVKQESESEEEAEAEDSPLSSAGEEEDVKPAKKKARTSRSKTKVVYNEDDHDDQEEEEEEDVKPKSKGRAPRSSTGSTRQKRK